MRPFCLTWLAMVSTAAAELPTPDVHLHPDGARLTWMLTAPAGETVYELAPGEDGRTLSVSGATTWRLSTVPQPAAEMPAAAETWRVVRNGLRQRAAVLAARRAVLDVAEERLRTCLAQAAHAEHVDTAGWQAALDALLEEQATMAAAEAALAREREALRRDAGAFAEALALEDGGPLTAADLARRWQVAGAPATQRSRLVVSCTRAGPLSISTTREDMWWTPSATLRLGGTPAVAVLTRTAEIVKPRALALGAVHVEALAAPLHADLARPPMRRLAVHADDVGAALRRQLSTGQRSVEWTSAPAGLRSVGAAPPVLGIPAPVVEIPASSLDVMPVRLEANARSAAEAAADTPRRTVFAHGVDLDLGTVTFAAGSTGLGLTIDRTTVSVVADEWALFPEEQPLAMRRVSVRLGAQPLLAGRLQVIADAPPRQGEVPALAAGSLLTVCAAIDETICLSSTSSWEVDPASNTSTFRRTGTDHWLLNSGSAPRTVAVYRTMPVSTSDELQVTRDAASTRGATVVAPGLLRWKVTLPPGDPQRIGLGWVMRASGSFSF